MINFIKGFVIGIGKIVPGVSGAMLAISLGVYDKAIYYICNFKNDIKNSFKYLFPLGVGIIISIVLFSKVISLCLNKYYVITMLFFIGLIIGGIPDILNKVNKNNYYISIISCIIFTGITIFNVNNSYIIKNNFIDFVVYFISGMIETIGTIVPGVSGTALLMIIGTYDSIIYAVGNITNIKLLIPFILGMFISLVLFIKLIDYSFNKYNDKMYALIFGLLISSIFILILQVFRKEIYIGSLILGIIFMLFGIFISSLFKDK